MIQTVLQRVRLFSAPPAASIEQTLLANQVSSCQSARSGIAASIQSVFDIHQTGHGNALSVSGWPVLVNLDEMKANIQ